MPNKFIPPQTDSVARSAATPLDGEVFYDTDEKKLYYGDGTTVGGLVIGSGGHTIEEEGTPLTQRAKLNFVGDSITVTDDAGNDRTIVTVNVPSGGREVLTANRTYYVRTDGNDSNNGLTDTAGGAFLTLPKGVSVIKQLDLNGYVAKLKISQSFSLSETLTLPVVVGGIPVLEGNTTTPTNTKITVTSSSNHGISVKGSWKIDGISIATGGANARGINVDNGAVLEVGRLDIANTSSHGLSCELNAVVNGVGCHITRSGTNTGATIIALLSGAINLLNSTLNMTSGSASQEYRVLLGGVIDTFGATKTGGTTQLIETGGQIR